MIKYFEAGETVAIGTEGPAGKGGIAEENIRTIYG